MRIAYITAGAAGMFCGSCMRDNTLAAALIAEGHDALLIPTYTPIRTDEDDVSSPRVFFGGINVYLQQKFSLFRYTPRWFDRLFDFNWLLRWVSRFAVHTQAQQLGDLTISMLQGEHGFQAKEIDKLTDWLANDIKPDIVNLSNLLIAGMAPKLRDRLKVPILGSLQGDDIFLEMLPTSYRTQAIDLISKHTEAMQGFIATSRYYADFMSEYLRIPRERIDVVQPGIKLKGYGIPAPTERDPVIGYFARICPEKGLHQLVDAFCILKRMPEAPPCRLHVSGWLGENYRPYFMAQWAKMEKAGVIKDFKYFESPDHSSKVRFLQSIDILSVPTTYREPKGLYVLEAWANGVPVVQPAHGAFPELIEATGGGLLVPPEEPESLASALRHLLDQPAERRRLGQLGHDAVHERFHDLAMARETVKVYQRHLNVDRPKAVAARF